MTKTKCPKCGHIQPKIEIKSTKTKMFMEIFEKMGATFDPQIECKKCKTVFSQNKHEIETEDDKIQKITQKFVDKYFNDDPDGPRIIVTKDDWIGGEIGGVLKINDYYFNFDFMQKALELNATSDEVFGYYWLL